MDSPDDKAASLEAMKYRDLQKVAKEVGVKANLPKAQLVQKILEARSSKGEEDRVELVDPSPKVATPKAKTVTPMAKSATPKAEQARKSKGSSAKKATTPKAQSIRKPIKAKSATPSKADPLRARLSSTPASILKAKMKANRSVSTAEKLAKAMSDMTPDSIELVTPSPQRLATPKAKLVTPKAKLVTPKAKLVTPKAKLVTPKAEMVTKKAKGTPKMVRMKTPSAASALKSVKKTPYASSHKKKTPAPAAAAAPTGIPRFVPKKAPDFAKLHAKEFGKMDSLDVYLSKKKDRSIKKVARNVAKERFEKAREITREHRAEMDRLSKRVTPAAAADKSVRRSPRNNAENNPPQVQSSNTFVPSNLVVGEFNFGGVTKRLSNKAFKFTARSAKPALAEKTNNRSKAGSEAAVAVKRPMGYKPHTGKLKDWNEVQREKRMAMAAGMTGGGRSGGPSALNPNASSFTPFGLNPDAKEFTPTQSCQEEGQMRGGEEDMNEMLETVLEALEEERRTSGLLKSEMMGLQECLKEKQGELERMAAQNKSLREERVCKICLDANAAVVFDPCGHLCTCIKCSKAVRQCPVCRRNIKKKIRAFM